MRPGRRRVGPGLVLMGSRRACSDGLRARLRVDLVPAVGPPGPGQNQRRPASRLSAMAMTGARTAPTRHIRCFNRAMGDSWLPADVRTDRMPGDAIGARGYPAIRATDNPY